MTQHKDMICSQLCAKRGQTNSRTQNFTQNLHLMETQMTNTENSREPKGSIESGGYSCQKRGPERLLSLSQLQC